MTSLLTDLRERRLDSALAAALAWWRVHPLAVLADVVTRLDRHVGSPAGSFAADAHRARVNNNGIRTRANLEALWERFAPDPRLTDPLIGCIGEPPLDLAGGSGLELVRSVAQRLVASPDERVDAWLAGLGPFLRARRGTRIGQLSDDEIAAVEQAFASFTRTGAAPPPLDDAQQVLLAEVLAELDRIDSAEAVGVAQGEALFQRVIADFDDDGAKRVYADWLLERGDPMGEYLTLSMGPADLDKPAAARLRKLQALADVRDAAIVGRREYDRGFPVRAFSADKYGVRKGRYGTELVWGTIRATDMVPTSDDCHTENLVELHVGTTFAADLARLQRPLAVRHLVLTSISKSAGGAWKKVTVLSAVTELTVVGQEPQAVGWFLAETPTGRQVRTLHLPRTGPMLTAAPTLLRDPVREIHVGPQITLTRDGERTRAVLTLTDLGDVRRLAVLMEPAAQPLVDVVVLRTSLPEADTTPLLGLGEEVERQPIASPVAGRATRVRDGDRLVIRPEGRDVVDAGALADLLAGHAAGARVAVEGAADLRDVGRMWEVARAEGASSLSLRRCDGDPHVEAERVRVWGSGHLGLAIDEAGLVAEIGTSAAADLLLFGLAAQRWPRVRVALAPGVADPAAAKITEALAAVTEDLEVGRMPTLRVWTQAWKKTRKRLELAPAAGIRAGVPTPEVLDALVAAAPGEVAAVKLALDAGAVDIGPCIVWVATRRVPLDVGGVALAWTGTGVGATVRQPNTHQRVLQALAPGCLERVHLVAGAVREDIAAAAARAAGEVVVDPSV